MTDLSLGDILQKAIEKKGIILDISESREGKRKYASDKGYMIVHDDYQYFLSTSQAQALLDIAVHNKLLAIKVCRLFFPNMGLRDAKMTVELLQLI